MNSKQEKLKAIERVLDIMDTLRDECPWDKKQTFESLRHLTIEETYELGEAILSGDRTQIKKELGDLLLHIVFYSKLGITHSFTGLILAHTALGTPFVVITVTATLTGFDNNLIRASQSLGADTMRTFFKVIMPLILPGVVSGALFAFITSFDEVVVVLFVGSVEQITIPRQMWAGLRQEISPTILSMATCLVALSIALLTTVELLRRRSERLRGIKQR